MTNKTAAYGLPYPVPSSDGASAIMRRVRRIDTSPEMALRSMLHRAGYRFRKGYKIALPNRKTSVDIAFPGEGLAVFVDGCFWHQCPEHGVVPQANRAYWGPKLARNVERDDQTSAALRRAGWHVLRFWEHVPPDQAAVVIAETIDSLRARGSVTRCSGPALDLFAGAGGSTAGLKSANFKVVGAVESAADAAKTYRSNHREVALLEKDIRDVDPAEFRKALRLAKGELALLNACPPCQGFSTLGLCDASDSRNDLVGVIVPFLEAFLPKAFIVENVPGLRTDQRMTDLIEAAEKLGYALRCYTVNATDFGVPQSRRRLIAIGVRNGEVTFPEHPVELLPRSFERVPPPVPDVLACAGSIEKTRDPVHRARRNSPEVVARIECIPVNGDRFDLPEKHQLRCHRELGPQRSASGPYGRMRLDQPAPTLTTRCTTPSCGRFVHPTEHRGISLREAALLQTFPPRYQFSGSYQSIEGQIGNAVPARLAEGLAFAASALMEGENG
jgi:DNA (cytosine-5)-methyltransferase 1